MRACPKPPPPLPKTDRAASARPELSPCAPPARDLADFLLARFYCGNCALIQALYALRADDMAEFEDGIADYR